MLPEPSVAIRTSGPLVIRQPRSGWHRRITRTERVRGTPDSTTEARHHLQYARDRHRKSFSRFVVSERSPRCAGTDLLLWLLPQRGDPEQGTGFTVASGRTFNPFRPPDEPLRSAFASPEAPLCSAFAGKGSIAPCFRLQGALYRLPALLARQCGHRRHDSGPGRLFRVHACGAMRRLFSRSRT